MFITTGEFMKTVQKVFLGIAALGLLAAAGCKPYDYTMQRSRIFLMGRLLVGQTCDVRVIWRKAPNDEVPVTVTADLSEIGGPAEQELAPDDNNTGVWRWKGQVTPDASGERIVTITSVDSREQTKTVRKGFPVFSDEKAVAIGAGDSHRLAVKADGTVLAWGCEDLFGDNLGQCDAPSTITEAVAVTGGGYHSVALKAEGIVTAWGKYYKAQPDNDSVITPIEVPEGLSDVVAIAASGGCNLALKADGRVVAWGGRPSGYGECDVPEDLTDVIAISAGAYSRFALKPDGAVVSWGSEITINIRNAIAVSTGSGECAVAVDEYGTASVYGEDYCVNIPLRAGGGFKALAYSDSGLGLRYDGTVVSWSYIDWMIDHFYVNKGPRNVLAIALSPYLAFRLALAEDGTVTDWYDDWFGHTENPVPVELQ